MHKYTSSVTATTLTRVLLHAHESISLGYELGSRWLGPRVPTFFL